MVIADILKFFGRLHPLVLHLPIGMFALIVLYVLFTKRQDERLLRNGLLVNMAFTVVTVVFGLILASEGGYDADTLRYHKLSGIAFLVVLVMLLFVIFRRYTQTARNAIFGVSLVLLVVTGHFGGVLTHGSTYLTEHFKGMSSAGGETMNEIIPVRNLDSARVFSQIVYPVFKQKCVSCHNPVKRKGGLALSSYAAVHAGGDHGACVIPGDPNLSDLLRRARLPENHTAAMPPEGNERVNGDELAVISWWIENGAADSALVGEFNADANMTAALKRLSGSSANEILRVRAPDPDSVKVSEASKGGWLVKPLAAGSNALWVKAANGQVLLESLRDMAGNIYDLDISGISVDSDWTDFLSQCTNLSLLNMSRCAGVEHALASLPASRLRVLILNGTDLDDLQLVAALDGLERVYLLDTKVDPGEIAGFKTTNPEVEVIADRFMFESLE